ncbi:DUF2441 domain-containing protein [Paraburkholderia phenazinium]|jgi:hypothetical protein|uniref:Uncharacterized protein n=1 Tax=Paraburkholderia phenazinium TaxID=60549 RepID=A0A1N6KMI6_9BURK|nr:DUF2441 domain-containing protein [Paraburkholderia phenazinium]SIO57771.1 Protein of unknown function [Paraburkholderia phenazinium]
MQSIYYYVARRPHAAGELLGGGHFGAGYRNYVFDDGSQQGALNGWKLARELILERVRQEQFANLPSRFDCSFAYLDKATASHNISPSLFLHEVELVDPNAIRHIADFNAINYGTGYPRNESFLDWAEKIAHVYWSGRDIAVPELLTLSPLRVRGRVS